MSSTLIMAYAGLGLTAYFIILVLYRLFLHPLASFPGPKLAAATAWYEFYHDAIRRGKYTFEIQEMHDKYGPIVRISPEELHCNDPSFIPTLYTGGSARRNKYGHFADAWIMFGTLDHDLHRLRRKALNRFFSKASISKLEPVIHEKVELLGQQLCTYLKDKGPVNITHGFSCLTGDVIMAYCFARNENFLGDRSFQSTHYYAQRDISFLGLYSKHFPFVLPLTLSLPSMLRRALNPYVNQYMEWVLKVRAQICRISSQKEASKQIADEKSHATIFDGILESDLPDEEKTLDRLWQEFEAVLDAGTDTVAWALSVLFFYILNDRTICETLISELKDAIPDATSRPSWTELEKLPYLIRLRLSYGLSTRLQRISPDGPMLYEPSDFVTASKSQYMIPQGTPVGMTSVMIHHDPNIFPNSKEFKPSRWLDAEGNMDRTLEKYLLNFSKGSRQCIGINLAYTELFITTSMLFRRLGSRMKLYETGLDDVESKHHPFMPYPRLDSKGIRVVMV
ncbi:putative cytochrome P450 [Rostrohypoxylon terebratum]|nr:putative cytochrome P450 [Rostrohypoxylon terebratum]